MMLVIICMRLKCCKQNEIGYILSPQVFGLLQVFIVLLK